MAWLAGVKSFFLGLQLFLGLIDKITYDLRIRAISQAGKKAAEGELADRLDGGEDVEKEWNRDA